MPEFPETTASPAVPTARRSAWLLALLMLLALASGMALGRWLGASAGGGDRAGSIGLVELLITLPLVVWLVLFVHEAGHLLAARLHGWPFLLLLVGPLRVVKGSSGLVWNVNRAWATWGGLTASIPPAGDTFRREMLTVVLAGPLASLLLGAAALWVANSVGVRALVAQVTGVTSVLIGLVTLLPVSSGGYQSDGSQALDLLRGDDTPQRRARRLSVLLQTMAGIRPRDVDVSSVPALIAETPEPRERLALWMLMLQSAVDRRSLGEAATAATEVAARVASFPDGMRQMVALDLAWYHGRYARDADAARAWIAQARGGFVDPFQRPLADAALAHVEGRLADARRAVAEARRLLPRAMDRGGATAVAEQLDELARDLDAAGA